MLIYIKIYLISTFRLVFICQGHRILSLASKTSTSWIWWAKRISVLHGDIPILEFFLIKFKKKLLNNKSLKFSMEVLVWVSRHARYKIWVTANSISLNFELKKCIRFIVMPFSLPRISSSAVFLVRYNHFSFVQNGNYSNTLLVYMHILSKFRIFIVRKMC